MLHAAVRRFLNVDPRYRPADATRVAMVLGVSATYLFAGTLLIGLLTWVDGGWSLPLVIVMVLGVSVCAPMCLMSGGRADQSAILLCVATASASIAAMWLEGGGIVASPWYILTPLMAALLLGLRGGVLFGVASAVGALVSLYLWWVGLLDWHRLTSIEVIDTGSSVIAIALVVAIGSLYHWAVGRSAELVAEQKERLAHVARVEGEIFMAASLLHDVGNGLTVASVAPGFIRESLDEVDPARLAGLLEEQIRRTSTSDGAMAGALTTAHRLALHVDRVHRSIRAELDALERSIGHVRAVLEAQRDLQPPLDWEQVDLAAVAAEVVRLRGPIFGSVGIALGADLRVAVVRTDVHSVLRVLHNLLANARDSVLEAGTSDPRVEVRTGVGPQGDAYVQVEDRGVGLAEGASERLFGRGYTTKSGGQGYGLHNARSLAERLGGSLRVSSAGLGRGATFTLTLPTQPFVS